MHITEIKLSPWMNQRARAHRKYDPIKNHLWSCLLWWEMVETGY